MLAKKIHFGLMLVITCISLTYSMFSWAENEDSLYTAYVPVDTQTTEDRQAALPLALTQVLIKISGNPQVASIAAISTQLPSAAQMLDSYRYQTSANDNPSPNTVSRASLELVAEFDEKQVNHLLQNTKQPIWPRKRPTTLVWLINVGETGKQFVHSNDTANIMMVLQDAARERGIPILFPLFDLTDLGQVTLNDVWTPDIKAVQEASNRYASDGILIGKILPLPDSTPDVPRWQGQWVFLLDGSKLTWQTMGSDEEQVATRSINELADLMAKRFAKAAQTSGKIEYITIEVSGITSMDEFTKVNVYLSSLDAVSKLSVQKIENHQVIFDLTVAGGEFALRQTLATDKVLTLIPPALKISKPGYLHYQVAL